MTARSNGLRASSYAVLIEIEESLGDRMLEALAERQIAAYVVPAPGPGGATRLILHVDALRRVPAGIVLAGLTPALAGESPAGETPADNASGAGAGQGDQPAASTGSSASLADEAAFAEIVAGFHRLPMERTWPEAEDLPPEPLPAAPPAAPATERRRGQAPDVRSAARKPDPDDDEEEHYTPPALPRLEPHPPATRWALIALGLGLALLLLPTLFAFGHRTSLDVAGVVCLLGATAVLVSRLRERSPDDPDDGAVV